MRSPSSSPSRAAQSRAARSQAPQKKSKAGMPRAQPTALGYVPKPNYLSPPKVNSTHTPSRQHVSLEPRFRDNNLPPTCKHPRYAPANYQYDKSLNVSQQPEVTAHSPRSGVRSFGCGFRVALRSLMA
eukprot:Blabericola_migrator_1__5184@NODE_2673_length_2476_cov_178_674554_g1672_i0_p2_GENE_NODE_2673_length_2476_cov_178_674554_g1672_i0NODE_2673_length_2476_cov_178_674554_g1672_i0_p2_ORF_typecomplete_len128_score12_47_NODE_2673_length_2476_cov_178_674554_g1672_i0366749